jgi:hypothetical protein
MTKDEPNIIFLAGASKEVMRIDKNGVTVNPDLPIDEAAQYVISALNEHINMLVLAEREACADVVESTPWSDWFRTDCAAAIRERGKQA